MKPISILVICPRQIDYLNCQSIDNQEKHKFHFLEAPLQLSGFSSNFDVIAYLDKCRHYIQKHDIQVVLATRDIPSLWQSQLAQEFEHLKGGSVESAFLCLHKYYTHKLVDFEPIKYNILLLNKEKNLQEYIQNIDISFPWMMKPCMTACSSSIFKIHNIQDAQKAILFYENTIVKNFSYLLPFLESYLGSDKYPLIYQDPILIEEYINFSHKCCVDGCVSNGEIIIWGISDNHYYCSKPECFADFTFPSTLPKSIQEKLNQAYKEIVQRLIEYGFDNQFVDVEFFVSDRGEIKIIEVNGRMIPVSACLYRQCLNQGDPYTALIKIGMGYKPETPTLNGLVGGIFYITTFGQDLAKNLLNFEIANSIPNLELRVTQEQEITQISDCGFSLATVTLVGNSYEEIHQQANLIRRQLLKQPDFSPWN